MARGKVDDMRKTNSRETRRAVEAYVLDEVAELLELAEVDGGPRPLSEAFAILRDEMEYQTTTHDGREIVGRGIATMRDKSGRKPNYTRATTPYWVWYLAAAVGCFEVYTDRMRALVAEWMDETPDEAARFSNIEVEKHYYHMTAGAFDRLYSKEAR